MPLLEAPQTMLGQLWAYAIGGGAMTALHSLTYWVLARVLAVEPYIANTLAAVVAGLAGYWLHSRWTFGHRVQDGDEHRAFVRYTVVSALCFALNSFWVWLVVKQLSRSVELSIVPMIVATPWLGFVLNRFWAFKRSG